MTPLQYSCLKNPMDGGAWWAAAHGVAKSQTQLSDFTFTFFHSKIKNIDENLLEKLKVYWYVTTIIDNDNHLLRAIICNSHSHRRFRVSSVHYFHPGYTVVLTSYAYKSMCMCLCLCLCLCILTSQMNCEHFQMTVSVTREHQTSSVFQAFFF